MDEFRSPGVWLRFLSGRMELILFAPDRVKVMV